MPYYDVDFPIRGVITRTVKAKSKKAAAQKVRTLTTIDGDHGIECATYSLVFALDEPPNVEKLQLSTKDHDRKVD